MTTNNPTAYQSIDMIANTQGNTLHELHQKAKQLEQLQHQLHHYLLPDLRSHCRIVSWIRGTLIIGVDNANYITQLRYNSMNLRDQLRQHSAFANISTITYKVIPLLNQQIHSDLLPRKDIISQKKINPHIAEQLLSSAKALARSQNPQTAYLQQILEKLATYL